MSKVMELTSDTTSSLNSGALGLSQPALVEFDLLSLLFFSVNTLVISRVAFRRRKSGLRIE